MKERMTTALMLVTVTCAVLTTGLATWTVLKPASDGKRAQGQRVRDWRSYSKVGVSAGSPDAKVVLVEFFDFQCPACRRFSLTIDSLMSRNSGIRLVRRNFPLMDIHPWASRLAIGGVCAERFGEFHQYYRRAFDAQALVGGASWGGVADLFSPRARTLELERCLIDKQSIATVEADIAAGRRLGVAATPSVLINDRLYSGAWSVKQLDSLISRAR